MNELEQLYLDNESLVYFVLHKQFSSLIHDEDIIQCGKLGLWKACKSYDPAKAKFSTYATMCIRNDILQELRKRDTKGLVVISLNEPVPGTDKGDVTIQDVIPEEKDRYADIEVEHVVAEILSKLEGKHKAVFDMMMDGYTQMKIADHIGISQAQVSRILRKIRNEIYNMIK